MFAFYLTSLVYSFVSFIILKTFRKRTSLQFILKASLPLFHLMTSAHIHLSFYILLKARAQFSWHLLRFPHQSFQAAASH